MKTRIMKNILIAFVCALTFGSAINASADFIEGSITMSGDFQPMDGTSLGDATGLDFIGDDFIVDGANGTFAAEGISAGDIGTYNDFTFAPLSVGTIVWEIDGFDFMLNSIAVVLQTDFFIVLQGTGMISGNGYESTTGTWSLTGNSAGLGTSLFNFSSGATAASEPGSLALFGLGLIGLAVARRRSKNS